MVVGRFKHIHLSLMVGISLFMPLLLGLFPYIDLSGIVANAFALDEKAKPSKEEAKEIVLSPEQMKRYASTYKDPCVRHIRKVIDNYLNGKLVGNDKYDDLKAVDQEYLRNRFVVLSVKNSIMGGREISLISQKKPDKIFWTWIYKYPDGVYELRAFAVEEHREEEIRNIRSQFKRFLEDKNLSL